METLAALNAEIETCRRCPRLVAWREQVAREKRKAYRAEEYWGKPVPGFGDPAARIFVVGLAPGAHGSNRTGRMFTGDGSGDFLFPALHRAGFASQPQALSRFDGLTLTNLYLSAAGRCAPPENKPTPAELTACQPYLLRELELIQPKVIVALGRIAFESVLRIFFSAQNEKRPLPTFAHGAVFALPTSPFCASPASLICSYHPSRQNTQTGRLTAEMFDEIWSKGKMMREVDQLTS